MEVLDFRARQRNQNTIAVDFLPGEPGELRRRREIDVNAARDYARDYFRIGHRAA